MQPDGRKISVYRSISDKQARIYCGFTVAVHAYYLRQKGKQKVTGQQTLKHVVTEIPWINFLRFIQSSIHMLRLFPPDSKLDNKNLSTTVSQQPPIQPRHTQTHTDTHIYHLVEQHFIFIWCQHVVK